MHRWRAVAVVFSLLITACGGESRRQSKAGADASRESRPRVQEGRAPARASVPPIARDLPVIQKDRALRVLFTFNSAGYFVYRGETMGFEYELLSGFARDSGLRLVPVVVRDSGKLIEMLNRGEGDVIAAQLVAPSNESEVLLTDGLYSTAPVLVQKRGQDSGRGTPPAVSTALDREEIRTPGPIKIRARVVSKPRDLEGQRVHLSQASPYRRSLLELDEEVGGDIDVIEIDETTDKLIQRLAEGEIAFTVAAENLAALKTSDYANLLITPLIGPRQQIVWAMRRNAPALHDALNRWLADPKRKLLKAVLYRKYFQDRRGFSQRAASRYLTSETGRLSPFDDWFREYALTPGWDWRLIAAQAYQESRFDPRAHSWAGATGVMQIMPRTARELRVNPNDPRQSIEGACRYLWKLDDQWKNAITSDSERIKFILGSYNIGMGHVQDAQRLAKKHGDDPAKWADVGYWLIRKSKRGVYNDPVVKYGFARGTEAVGYVDLILDRFEHYKAFVRDEEVAPSSEQPVAALQ